MLRSSHRPTLALVLLALLGACSSNSASTTPPPDAGPGPNPPPPLKPEIFVDRSPAAADGRDGVVVTVVARDASGNPLAGAPVQFDPGGATIARSMATTDRNGVAVVVLTATAALTAHVTATTPSGTLTADATFTKGAWGTLTSGMLGGADVAIDPFRSNALRGSTSADTTPGFGPSAALIVESHSGGVAFTTRAPAAKEPANVFFAPQRRDVQYAVTDDKCLVRSTDGGATFEQLRCDVCAGAWIAPSDSNVLYAGTGTCPNATLSRSSDGGATWENVGPMPDPNGIVVSPDDANTLFVLSILSPKDRLKRSVDGGRTWTAIDAPLVALQEGVQRFAVVSSKIVYAEVNAISYYALGGPIGIVATKDGGATWSAPTDPDHVLTKLNGAGGLDPGIIPQPYLLVNPVDPSTVYLHVVGASYRSRDGAATWAPISRFGFAFDPHDARTMIATQSGERSTDGGDTWSAPLYPPRSDYETDLYTIIGAPDHVFAAFGNQAAEEGCYATEDGGRTWTPSAATGCDRNTTVATALGDGALLIAGEDGPEGPGVQRSSDSGKTWTRVAVVNGAPNGGAGALAAAPDEPSGAYAATKEGIQFSSDGGQTWSPLTLPALPSNAYVSMLAAGPKGTVVFGAEPFASPQTVWIGTRNGGWTVIATQVDDCTISPVDAGTLLCLQRTGGKIVRSADGGKTFATVVDGLDEQTAHVPVWARDGKAAFIRDAKGISRSVDGGATWTHVADLPPKLPVTAKIGLAAESATVLYAGQYRIELPAP